MSLDKILAISSIMLSASCIHHPVQNDQEIVAQLQEEPAKASVPRYHALVPELTTENYETIFSSEKPKLIDIVTGWCSSCKAMEPHLNLFAFFYGDQVTVAKLIQDPSTQLSLTRENPSKEAAVLLKRMRVEPATAFPTQLFINQGHVAEEEGYASLSSLIALANYYFGIPKPDEETLKAQMTKEFLKAYGLPEEEHYDKGFHLDDVAELTYKNVRPLIANLYGDKFKGAAIAYFVKGGYTPAYIAQFPEELSGREITNAIQEGKTPEETNKESSRETFK